MRQERENKERRFARLFTIVMFAILCVQLTPYTPYAAHMGNEGVAPGDGAFDNFSDPNHNIFLEEQLFHEWTGAHMMMAEQLVSVMLHQITSIGMLMDATVTLRNNRLLQRMTTEAHKDYHPSVQMCALGTNVRSLARAYARGKANAKLFNEVLLHRDLRRQDVSSSKGHAFDYEFRKDQFVRLYCDPEENDNEIEPLCTKNTPPNRISRNIDFHRLIDGRHTLNIDFTDDQLTPDEEDVISFTKNVISHDVFDPFPAELLDQKQAKDEYSDLRSAHAIRSVARHSLTNIVGMKAKGSNNQEVDEFMKEIIRELGIQSKGMPEDAVIDEWLGKNPSYFAQMEVLTNKLYQTPSFYVNLYDKPTNVKRTRVALKAFELMQNRDRFEAALRREMLVSMILETKLRQEQETMDDKFRSFRASKDKKFK